MTFRSPARRPPLWFELALLGVVWAVTHVLGLDGREPAPVSLAFFAWLIIVGQWVWAGIQVLGQVALSVLQWTVHVLLILARETAQGLREFAGLFLRAGKHIWEFFRATYVQVLRPMWDRIWRFVDWARRTLVDIFRPILKFLNAVRREVLKFYDRFVRPVLDTIGLIRKVLRVTSALGLEWAKKLDAYLGTLEEKIDAPFRFLLRKINEVINLIDRVVTADGLFQRLALVRSIERDIRYVSNAFHNWRRNPLSPAETAALADRNQPPTRQQLGDNFERFLVHGDGPLAAAARDADLTGTIFAAPE